MEMVKLGKFVVLADGRRYCVVNQKMIGDSHFARVLTVPKKVKEIKNADYRLLKSCILAGGKIGTHEYGRHEKDYQQIMNIMASNA